MQKPGTPKRSEAALCAEFRKSAEAAGFTVYPEVENWDLLLVVPDPVPEFRTDVNWSAKLVEWIRLRPGDQIGVQAKSRGDLKVLWQVAGDFHGGPHYRVVLVDQASREFMEVAAHCGVPVVAPDRWGQLAWHNIGFMWKFDSKKPLDLPPVVTDLPAGGSGPRQLTKWRVGALKMCKLIRARGYATTADFKAVGIDSRRWIGEWLRPAGRCNLCPSKPCVICGGHRVRYLPHPRNPLPDVGWEAVTKQLDEAGLL